MNTINFTAAYHQHVKEQIFAFDKLNAKFRNIDLAQYTDAIGKLTIVFQAFDPESPNRTAREYKKLRRKDNSLELYLVTDYQRIKSGNKVAEHLNEVFINGCHKYLKPIKDFNWAAWSAVMSEE